MKLSEDLKARQCGGCRTRVVTRDEFVRWVAAAVALEQERDRVERDYLDATRVGGEIANENARLREAIREEVERLRDGTYINMELDEIADRIERRLTEGKNDDER